MPQRIICTKCEYHGAAAKKKRGSGKVEMFGWAFFPLGVPYSIWRMFGKITVCKQCGHHPVIDEDSIIGQRMIEKVYGLDKAPPETEKPIPIATPAPITPLEKTVEILPQKRDKSIPRPEDDPNQF